MGLKAYGYYRIHSRQSVVSVLIGTASGLEGRNLGRRSYDDS